MTAKRLLAVAGLLVLLGGAAAAAQERVKIRVAALTLPVFNPIIVNLMKEKGIDARHGLEMEVKAYPSIAAFYAALATGEVDTTVVGGPTVFAGTFGMKIADLVTGAQLYALTALDLCSQDRA